MSAEALEAFLARIYVDPEMRAKFRSDPRGEAKKAGLTEQECNSLGEIDWDGLELAAQSFARKRHLKQRRRRIYGFRWIAWLRRFFWPIPS